MQVAAIVCGPRTHSSPGSPGPRSAPLSGSTTRSSVPGIARPTEPGATASSRSGAVAVAVVSVSP